MVLVQVGFDVQQAEVPVDSWLKNVLLFGRVTSKRFAFSSTVDRRFCALCLLNCKIQDAAVQWYLFN
jgi:hypothetical protein